MNRLQHYLAVVLSVSLINATVLQTAQAAMVTTEEVASMASAGQAEGGQARLAAALARSEVRAEMERLGVAPALAVERIATLTDDEAARLADQIDTAPAGGIIGAILLVFFVLLLTDIIGWTKVFPFTRSVR